jgi:hypothetical protein
LFLWHIILVVNTMQKHKFIYCIKHFQKLMINGIRFVSVINLSTAVVRTSGV